MQQLTIDGEPLLVISSTDEVLACRHGLTDQHALFVIAGNGMIAWRHVARDGNLTTAVTNPPGLSRRDFIAATFTASVAAPFAANDMAHHELIRSRYPVLSQAILAGASAQVRNMATTGGNLLQRTRRY